MITLRFYFSKDSQLPYLGIWITIKDMKRISRKSFKIVAAVGMTMFSLLVAFTATFAWFSANQDNNVGGGDVHTTPIDLNFDYFLYQYDISDIGNVKAVGDTKEERIFDLNDFSMHSYDTIFTRNNKYTYSLLRIEISGQDISEGGTVETILSRDVPATEDSSVLPSVFSSAIRFSCCINQEFYHSKPSTLFSRAIEYFKGTNQNYDHFEANANNSKVFPTNAGTTLEPNWSKPESLAFDLEYTSDDFNRVSNVNYLNVYIFFEYDTVLVENFAQTSISSQGLGDNEINLDDDLKNIRTSCYGE